MTPLLKSDSVRISCIGYKVQNLAIRNLNTPIKIELEEDRILLPGVIIHELSAKEFIRKSVSKIPDNYTHHKKELKAFYWNSVKHENTFTDFYEGYIRISKPGKISYDSTIRTIRSQSEHIQLFDSLQDIINFDVINQTSMFVNPVNLNDWKFEYQYSSEQPDGSFVIIEATMIKNPFSTSKESNTLKIFIHTPSYAIVRIDFSYHWQEGKRYYWKDNMQYVLSQLNGTVEYSQKVNSIYSLNYLCIGTEFSFMKRYDPTIINKAYINHELVILERGKSYQKPVVRWSDYLDATDALGIEK